MSRLLMLLPAITTPLDAGAKLRNDGLLRALATGHEVDAVAFGPASAEAEFRLASHARRVRVVAEPAARSPARRLADLATSPLPDMAQRRWSRTYLDAVRCLLNDHEYDAVQAEGIEMARYLGVVEPRRRVYDAHNAEFLLQRRFAATAGSAAARLYSRLQWRRLARFERAVVRGSRLTLAVSSHDANQLLALAGERADVRVVPNGVDASAYPFAAPRVAQAREVLFVGKLDFRPNAEGVAWFVDNVLTAVPATRLFAVGSSPPAWLVDAGQHSDRIAVTGYVADERPYLARCAALVLPLRAGGGSRLKALIAMASGVPIVSTRLGMEGLDAEPGVHFLLAETVAEWVDCLDRLFAEPELRQRLAHAGRGLVEQRYDWAVLRPGILGIYESSFGG